MSRVWIPAVAGNCNVSEKSKHNQNLARELFCNYIQAHHSQVYLFM